MPFDAGNIFRILHFLMPSMDTKRSIRATSAGWSETGNFIQAGHHAILPRRFLWAVIAKRWASSRMRCKEKQACEPSFSRIESDWFGQ